MPDATALPHHGTLTNRINLWVCALVGLAWIFFMLWGSYDGLWKLVVLSLACALALLAGAFLHTFKNQELLFRMDAMAAGAMLSSVLILIMPHALEAEIGTGMLGMGLGIIMGLILYLAAPGHQKGSILGALTLHAVGDGLLLGALNTAVPALGWGVGIAILAHKAPAGYVISRRLGSQQRPRILALLPALGTGVGALAVALLPGVAFHSGGLIFGIVAGLFIFVALEFLVASIKMAARDKMAWIIFSIGFIVIALIGTLTPHSV